MNLSRALRIVPGDVVAITGGGGKTTTMFRLADELARRAAPSLRVLTTTTTRLFTGQLMQAPAFVSFDPDTQTLPQILSQLNAALNEHGQVMLARPTEPGATKAVGLPPETINDLANAGYVDVIIVEADGARNHPFKAPAAYEPVIPTCTTVTVPVIGLDVVGKILNDENVHRPVEVSRLSGLPLGQPVTEETVACVLSHPQGGLKNVPSHARVISLLNKAETPTRLAAAYAITDRLLQCPQIDSVAVTAVQNKPNPVVQLHNRTAAIILAAGGSARFGAPKQLAQWAGQTFVEQVVDTALASQADSVIVVLGAEVERSLTLLKDKPVQIVFNSDWADGQSTSVKAGLEALSNNIGSAIFLLVDQPGITAAVVDALIERYRQTLAPVVRPQFEGKFGNPVLFDPDLFAELQTLTGDVGGRDVVKKYQQHVEAVPVSTPVILQDFDKPEDLAQ